MVPDSAVVLSGDGKGGLRIAALSKRAQVSIPTIKFYLRSGLLHSGKRTGQNQMLYDESHVRRLRAIRVLIDYGGLSVATIAEVLSAAGDRTVPWILRTISRCPSTMDTPGSGALHAKWRDRLDAALQRDGRQAGQDNAAALQVINVLVGMDQAGHAPDDNLLTAYLRAGEAVAAAESACAEGTGQSKECAERLVVSVVLGAAALAAARRLGHDLIRAEDR